MSVLFADLSGYTALAASLDPEEVYGFLRPTLASLEEIVESFGGTVVFVAGDGLMAVFGVPLAHEDDAERAVRAAIAVRDRVWDFRRRTTGFRYPDVHAGIQTGEVIVVPTDEAAGFKVVGDTVNTASRLTGLAGAGKILVDPTTRSLTERRIAFGRRVERRAKGKRHPLATYEVKGLRPEREVAVPAAVTPFVGRTRAAAAMTSALEAVVATSRSHVMLVTGEPGSGKSRLMIELARTSDVTVFDVRCSRFGSQRPLRPLGEAIAGWGGTAIDGPKAELTKACDRIARRVDRSDRSLPGGLRVLFGLEVRGGRASIGDAARAVEKVIAWNADRRPVMVMIDDVQWADQELVSLVRRSIRAPWRGPVLFVCAGRPGFSLPGSIPLELGPLDDAAMRAMMGSLLEGEPAPAVVRASLSRSAGNPLFLEETTRMLVETGALVRDGGAWQIRDGEAPAEVPPSIRAIIAERLDGLTSVEKGVIQDAAVCGDRTWDALLARLSRSPARSPVRSLIERGMLVERPETSIPGTTELAFKHDLIREVAYRSLPRAERARRHMEVARWLRGAHGVRREPVASIAHHLEQACLLSHSRTGPAPPAEITRQAFTYLARWGDRTRALQARAAEQIYARALAVAADPGSPAPPGRVIDVQIGRAECLIEMGRHREAIDLAGRGLHLAEELDDRHRVAAALLALGRAESDVGHDGTARRLLDLARERFEQLGDVRGQAWALHRLSETWSSSDYGREIEDLKESYRLFQRARDRLGRAVVAQDLAYLFTPIGGEEFSSWYEAARRLSEDETDLRSRADLQRTRGYHCLYAGLNAEAFRTMKAAAPICAEAGDRYAEADALIVAATAALVVADPSEAAGLASRGMEIGRELSSSRIQIAAHLATARASIRLGAPREAAAGLRAARTLVERRGHAAMSAEVALMRALIDLDRGRLGDVSAPLRTVGIQSRKHGWLMLLPLPPLIRGRALLAAGQQRRAARELRAAVDLSGSVDAAGTGALARSLLEQAGLLLGRDPSTPAPSPEPEVEAVAAENRGLRASRDGSFVDAAVRFGSAGSIWAAGGLSVWLARAHLLRAAAHRAAREGAAALEAEAEAEAVLDRVRCPAGTRRALSGAAAAAIGAA